jgi:ribosomal subunit interface protein
MEIQVTGRRVSVNQSVRERVVGKSEKLSRFLNGISRIEVILDAERKKNEYTAEMIVHAPRGNVLVCSATESTQTAALDMVVERAERQLKRFKGRKRAKKARRRAQEGAGTL